MDHLTKERTNILSRLGFHYFVDSEKFQDADAEIWSGALKHLNAKWLVVKNPANRAIPEGFIKQMTKANVNLIVDFDKNLTKTTDFDELNTLIKVYGRWGVKYANLYHQPNFASKWDDNNWSSVDIVEKHLENFIQFAKICVENNIHPVFSPLFPGGDYWDLAFLEKSLELLSSSQPNIIRNLVLSAYGWDWNRSLDWGAGGKKKWPKVKPYLHANDLSQDQQGFRTYEWYLEVSDKVLGKKLPILIFDAGKPGYGLNNHSMQPDDYLSKIQTVTALLTGKNVYDPKNPNYLFKAIQPEVIGCNFFVLSADTKKELYPYRWFAVDGNMLGPAGEINNTTYFPNQSKSATETIDNSDKKNQFKYNRYIFIANSLRGTIANILEDLDPYIRKFKPKIGFSLLEAQNAAYVLIIAKNKEEFLGSNEGIMPENNIVKIITPDQIFSLTKRETYEKQTD